MNIDTKEKADVELLSWKAWVAYAVTWQNNNLRKYFWLNFDICKWVKGSSITTYAAALY